METTQKSSASFLGEVSLLGKNQQRIPSSPMWRKEPMLHEVLRQRRNSLLCTIIRNPKLLTSESEKRPELFLYALHERALKDEIDSLYYVGQAYTQGVGVPEDLYFAFRLVKLSAEQGYAPAFATLGKHYANGIGTQQNIEEAIRWFLQTDFSNDAGALGILAWGYYNGVGVPKDEAKAYEYWIDAADFGHPDGFQFCKMAADAGVASGQCLLGYFFQCGIGTPANIQEALGWYHKAADQGNASAQYRLGVLYSEAIYGIEKDVEVAVQWLQLATAQNHVEAKHYLAVCLFYGTGIEQNEERATAMLTELAQGDAENKGHAGSQYFLGAILVNSEYAGYNPGKGVKWLRKSAEQGFAHAQLLLGELYYDGSLDVVKQNAKQARFWFHKAAKQRMSVALLHLGEIYGEGNGVHVDRKQAFRFYSQASETGLVAALQKMAHCYLHGIGTKKNEDEGYLVLATLALYGNDEESWTLLQNATESDNPAAEFGMYVYYRGKQNLDVAYEWLEKAAGQGNGNALCGMALRCEAEGDAEQRRDYFRLAAEAGNAEAQLRYALLLEDWSDKNAPTNQEAFKWMSASADAGHSQALCYLGDFYLDGFGTEVDRQKAFACYSKSAEMNNADGMERLGEYHAFGEVQNPSQAFYWFQRAAQLWHTKGLCNLGFCYLKGFGCQPDVVAGFQYITMAVESGDPIAMKMLKSAGLDVEKMSSGYRESLKVEASARKGDFSGAGFERLFSTTGSRIPPVPPNSEE